MTNHVNFVTLDVFTTKPYEGNPLAVFNLSETIFIHPKTGTGAIDIFTESVELPFAGHPTIGAASWFLHHTPDKDAQVASLRLKAGNFPITLQDANLGIVAVRVAHNVHIHRNQYPPDETLRLYPSLKPHLAPSSVALFSVVKGMSQLLVELPSLEVLGAVTTAYGGQAADSSYLDAGGDEGLLATYFYVRDVEDGKLERKVIRTRMILGNLEDPATGSAASGLTVYLSLNEARTGQFKYDVVQGMEMGRRSEIGVDVVIGEVGRIESLELKGSAVKVSDGKIVVPPDV
ncbi:hypothetical protein BDW62DRAFT_212918 [Aspergillus aurantiobrunneus]